MNRWAGNPWQRLGTQLQLAAAQPEHVVDLAELRVGRRVETFRAEELEHRDIGLDNEAELAPAYRLLSAVIKTGCRIAIHASERI